MSENKKSHCSTSINCYSITALCVSFLTLGLLVGSWIGNCQKSTKYNKVNKCQSYSTDGNTGSTCNWSKKENDNKKY